MFGIDLGPFAPALSMLKAKLRMTEHEVQRAEVIERLREMASHIAADPKASVTVMRATMGGKQVMILAAGYDEGKTVEAGPPMKAVTGELPA